MITTLDLAAASSDPAARRMLASLSLSVAKSKRIVVVTGAGISCSCGIPVRRQFMLLHSIILGCLLAHAGLPFFRWALCAREETVSGYNFKGARLV